MKHQEAHEELHPETKHGGTPGKAGGGKVTKDCAAQSFAKPYTEVAAEMTGKSRSTVERLLRAAINADHKRCR